MIAEHGSDHLRMTDLAARTGMPMGSIYQYFPDKSAILSELAQRFMARISAGLIAQFGGITTWPQAMAATDAAFAAYYALFRAEPVMRDIWCGTQADKLIADLDIADSRANAAIVFAALSRIVAPEHHAAFATDCLLIIHLAGAAVRFAIALDVAEGDAVFAAWRRTAMGMLQSYANR